MGAFELFFFHDKPSKPIDIPEMIIEILKKHMKLFFKYQKVN